MIPEEVAEEGRLLTHAEIGTREMAVRYSGESEVLEKIINTFQVSQKPEPIITIPRPEKDYTVTILTTLPEESRVVQRFADAIKLQGAKVRYLGKIEKPEDLEHKVLSPEGENSDCFVAIFPHEFDVHEQVEDTKLYSLYLSSLFVQRAISYRDNRKEIVIYNPNNVADPILAIPRHVYDLNFSGYPPGSVESTKRNERGRLWKEVDTRDVARAVEEVANIVEGHMQDYTRGCRHS